MSLIRFASLLGLVALASPLLAQTAADDTPRLRDAIRERIAVSVNKRTGATVPAYHCRRAVEGCDRRLSEFASYLVNSARRHSVDHWLMAAMAFRESGFNPFAEGSVGEMGILQIHPRRPDAKQIRFLTDQWYRKRCRKQPGACQAEIVDHAARVLSRSLKLCGGDVSDALGAYNTGRCGGNLRYSIRILRERLRLRRSAGLEETRTTVEAIRRARRGALDSSS